MKSSDLKLVIDEINDVIKDLEKGSKKLSKYRNYYINHNGYANVYAGSWVGTAAANNYVNAGSTMSAPDYLDSYSLQIIQEVVTRKFGRSQYVSKVTYNSPQDCYEIEVCDSITGMCTTIKLGRSYIDNEKLYKQKMSQP